jgi:hypothetical protein
MPFVRAARLVPSAFYEVLDCVTQSTNAENGVMSSDFTRFTTNTTLPANVSVYAQT